MNSSLTSSVSGVSRSERAHPLVLYGTGQRAELALRPPASAHVTAALRLGHAVPVGGRLLAHRLQHLCVTEALSVVWMERWMKRGEEECVGKKNTVSFHHFFLLEIPCREITMR